MQTKLTLRMDEAVIRGAKRYAARSGRSVSGLVSDYFRILATQAPQDDTELTPIVRSLVGVLAGRGLSEEDHRHHLARKHR